MGCARNANDLDHQLHLDVTENEDAFNATVMSNLNPNTSLHQSPSFISSSSSSLTPTPFYSFIHSSTNLPALNHHLGMSVFLFSFSVVFLTGNLPDFAGQVH